MGSEWSNLLLAPDIGLPTFGKLLERFLPEVAGEQMPVYVVKKELAASAPVGYTSPTLDLAIKMEIGDRWRGRGAAMVLDLAVLYRAAYQGCLQAGHSQQVADRQGRLNIISSALHELAILCSPVVPVECQ